MIKEWLEPEGYKVKAEEEIKTSLTESHRGYTDLVAEKDREKALLEAMKTGLTMTITGIIAFLILFLTGYYFRIQTYLYIGFVVIAGLIADIFNTWGINATLLLKAKKDVIIENR